MPDLFDNFFGKLSSTISGGKTTPHYGGSSQVNSGKFYSYHMNGTNNKYWLTGKEIENTFAEMEPKAELGARLGSVSSMSSKDKSSRQSSLSE